MILLMLTMLFGQMIDMSEECQATPCVIDHLPFGVGRETVEWQMHYIAPNAVVKSEDGGMIARYSDYKFQGFIQTRLVDFVFSSDGHLREIGVLLSPDPKGESRYPAVLNLYFTMRDKLVESGLYDSVEYVYSFKNPYMGTTEAEAMNGEFSEQEEDALAQDQNGYLSKYRFGKVWSIFRNKQHPTLTARLSVAIQSGMSVPTVHLQYIETKYTKNGYVDGIEYRRARR